MKSHEVRTPVPCIYWITSIQGFMHSPATAQRWPQGNFPSIIPNIYGLPTDDSVVPKERAMWWKYTGVSQREGHWERCYENWEGSHRKRHEHCSGEHN